MKQYPAEPREDARVGLAGPLWGTAAALSALLVSLVTRWPAFAAIARAGAWINLFNLLPVWQLDGGRGFRAMSRGQRWLAVLTLGAMWFLTAEGLLVLLLLIAAIRALAAETPAAGDRVATLQYAALVVILAALCRVHTAGLAR